MEIIHYEKMLLGIIVYNFLNLMFNLHGDNLLETKIRFSYLN